MAPTWRACLTAQGVAVVIFACTVFYTVAMSDQAAGDDRGYNENFGILMRLVIGGALAVLVAMFLDAHQNR